MISEFNACIIKKESTEISIIQKYVSENASAESVYIVCQFLMELIRGNAQTGPLNDTPDEQIASLSCLLRLAFRAQQKPHIP